MSGGTSAVSIGGNNSAMTGLSGAVDAAGVLGGPVDASFTPQWLGRLPYGMRDGNDMGFDRSPTESQFLAIAAGLARRDLLARTDNGEMLVITGPDDDFLPQSDTLVFQGRPRTEVHLIEGTGHCAFSKLPEVMGMVGRWLGERLGVAKVAEAFVQAGGRSAKGWRKSFSCGCRG